MSNQAEQKIEKELTAKGVIKCVAQVFAHLVVSLGVETAESVILGSLRSASALLRQAFAAVRAEADLVGVFLKPMEGIVQTLEEMLRGPSVLFDRYITPAMVQKCPVLSERLKLLDKVSGAGPLRDKLTLYNQLTLDYTKYKVSLDKKIRELELSVDFFTKLETALKDVFDKFRRGEL